MLYIYLSFLFHFFGCFLEKNHTNLHFVFQIFLLFSCTCGFSQAYPPYSIPAAAAAAKSLQSCLTLCDPIDGSPPGSPVPGILQARTLECVAISFSNAGKWKVKVKSLSRVRLLATTWTAAYQAPPSMGFSRQEYWSGVPSPSPSCHFNGILLRRSNKLKFWTYLSGFEQKLIYLF